MPKLSKKNTKKIPHQKKAWCKHARWHGWVVPFCIPRCQRCWFEASPHRASTAPRRCLQASGCHGCCSWHGLSGVTAGGGRGRCSPELCNFFCISQKVFLYLLLLLYLLYLNTSVFKIFIFLFMHFILFIFCISTFFLEKTAMNGVSIFDVHFPAFGQQSFRPLCQRTRYPISVLPHIVPEHGSKPHKPSKGQPTPRLNIQPPPWVDAFSQGAFGIFCAQRIFLSAEPWPVRGGALHLPGGVDPPPSLFQQHTLPVLGGAVVP